MIGIIKLESTPEIETERLVLRKFTTDDVQHLLKILSDLDVNRFLPWFPIVSLEEANKFLEERFLKYYKSKSSYRYAICLKEDNIPIGYMWLSNDQSNDFGYGLRRDHWNLGIATEAGHAVIDKIKDAGYSYITATHDVKNIASGVVMNKLGMKYKYSYIEMWKPKNLSVTFRMYQLNFKMNDNSTYMEYWDKYKNHYIEDKSNF